MRTILVVVALCAGAALHAQTPAGAAPRWSLSAGMGVAYASYADVTTLINASVQPAVAVPRFKTAAEFFGAFTVPVSDRWLVKFEYAYSIASFNPAVAFGPASFSVAYQMPSLILQYMLLDAGVYNVRVGAGGGYHFGSMEEKYSYLDVTYTGKGPGLVAEIEANTAFGDHLFAYLGVNLRWESVGTISDSQGTPAGVGSGGSAVTLHSFGGGARLGASYLF
jgi:hypothetical protein